MDAQVPGQAVLLLGICFAFFVSASAGLGGSLVLVPVLTLTLGAKEGIALAAVLLGGNNVVKLWAYRHVLPLRAVLVTVCTSAGALLGARLLVAVPPVVVDAAVVISLALALFAERRGVSARRGSAAAGFAFAAGATSGFSGTSGPLKGVAVRSLGLDRMRTIGAAAVVSAAADLTKVAVFTEAGLLRGFPLQLAIGSIPLMIAATFAGRHFTMMISEKGYARLFWMVIGGYAVRLLV